MNRDILIAHRYRALQDLGHGGEADVFLCEDTQSDKKAAVKVYRKNVHPEQEEQDSLLALNHENLVNILDFGVWNQRFIEAMEYVSGGTLDHHMPFSEEFLVKIVLPQVVEALNYLHQNRIIHRDLKPTNLFFEDEQQRKVLLGDFGISKKMKGDLSLQYSSEGRQSVEYAAPELIIREFGREVDYYALGITLMVLFKGVSPFHYLIKDEKQRNEHRIRSIHISVL